MRVNARLAFVFSLLVVSTACARSESPGRPESSAEKATRGDAVPSAQPAASPRPFSATIRDKSGSETMLNDLRRHTHHDLKNRIAGIVYSDEAMEFDARTADIPIYDGFYEVFVPLEVLSELTIDQDRQDPYGRPLSTGRAVLGDGTIVTGLLPDDRFVGTSDLGEFSIEIGSVRSLAPRAPAKATYRGSTPGRSTAILWIDEKKTLRIENASFITKVYNRNSILTGESRPAECGLATTGGSRFSISWDKIGDVAGITPELHGYSAMYDRDHIIPRSIRVKTVAGSEYLGDPDCHGIEGTAALGAYAFRVIIPFTSKAYKMEFVK